jgi:hypothetical protein
MIPNHICVSEEAMISKGQVMPVAYLEECRKSAVIFDGPAFRLWCFPLKEFDRIRDKYKGYSRSVAHDYPIGERISGCCDRADQY